MALDRAVVDRTRIALIREAGGRPLTAAHRAAAMAALTNESLRRNPQAGGGDFMGALGAGLQSPFWQSADTAPMVATAPEAAKPLEQMDADEFRAHAADALGAYGRARGFGSQAWQG